ncbi:hypothetical protein DYBT9275_03558 [Dyadobacter sp. CECT 9275]|uniref:Uncharacterized protein n=1 Tax=Dyadobacter helix TaxID=2822344 RepID=A0A916JEB6_9BACT|nr:hypothetical protein [Dyadobacter sp. CECT 9275]CAG5005302.1 hypothetical protein DYBT9275_03558 [Dyadobacter sp. CECT 9275]
MKEAIETAFPQVITGSCLETEKASSFNIFDSETEPKRCFIRKSEEEPRHFEVVNPSLKEIHFLAIDKCILTDSDSAHCDCAIFDDKQFSFLEISESKKLQRNEKRKRARIQLGQTIQHFRSKGISFMESPNAIICFVGKNVYPARTSSNNEARLDFFEDWTAILMEGNQIEF